MATETEISLVGGRVLHCYDTHPGDDTRRVVVWHHGTPNLGAPPVPLLATAEALGLRWVSYDRPGYGGSTPNPGRDIASAATDTAAVADALDLGRFAVMGHSGGGSHALACALVLGERVLATVSMAGLAPRTAPERGSDPDRRTVDDQGGSDASTRASSPDGFDWFAGMVDSVAVKLRTATTGHQALAALAASAEFDPEQFTARDYETLAGPWSWLGEIAGQASAGGPGGEIADDLAYVAPWGCDLGPTHGPVLLVHGGQDRVVPTAHAEQLAAHLPTATLWRRPDDGHLSVLDAAPDALRWLSEHTRPA